MIFFCVFYSTELRKGVARRGHAAELIDSENDNDEEVGPYTSANNKAIGEIMEGKKKRRREIDDEVEIQHNKQIKYNKTNKIKYIKKDLKKK